MPDGDLREELLFTRHGDPIKDEQSPFKSRDEELLLFEVIVRDGSVERQDESIVVPYLLIVRRYDYVAHLLLLGFPLHRYVGSQIWDVHHCLEVVLDPVEFGHKRVRVNDCVVSKKVGQRSPGRDLEYTELLPHRVVKTLLLSGEIR